MTELISDNLAGTDEHPIHRDQPGLRETLGRK